MYSLFVVCFLIVGPTGGQACEFVELRGANDPRLEAYLADAAERLNAEETPVTFVGRVPKKNP